MREELYQTLGALAGQVSSFYAASASAPDWAAALAGDLPSMRDAHVRLLMRHVLRPLVRACPPAHRYQSLIYPLPLPFVRATQVASVQPPCRCKHPARCLPSRGTVSQMHRSMV